MIVIKSGQSLRVGLQRVAVEHPCADEARKQVLFARGHDGPELITGEGFVAFERHLLDTDLVVLVDCKGEGHLTGGGLLGPIGDVRVEEAFLLIGFFHFLDATADLHRVENRTGVDLQGIFEIFFGQPFIALGP